MTRALTDRFPAEVDVDNAIDAGATREL